jgi:alkylation response protein AidB-like acyl-CoA dehydrogenase
MDFGLTPEQREIRDLCRQVGMEKFRPTAFERRNMEPPIENLRLLGDLGILGMLLPEEYGGGGRPALDGIIALEEISRACPTTGDHAVMAITGPAGFIAKWGTEEQKARYVPPVCEGRERWAISLTEPQAGSALTELRTSATIKGDECVVNGQKTFCSHASAADHILVFVRFGPSTREIGAIIVHPDTPGMSLGKRHRHMGGVSWSEVFFDDASIPVEDVLFTGDAMRKLLASYSLERCGAAAFILGVATIAMEKSVEYAEERRQFERPLSDFQFVQGKLADMYIALESAKLMVYRAMDRSSDQLPSRLDSSAARVAASDAACRVTNLGMEVHGATGLDQEAPFEWLYRVVRGHVVAGGTNDIHRSMVASELVGRRFDHRPQKVAGVAG